MFESPLTSHSGATDEEREYFPTECCKTSNASVAVTSLSPFASPRLSFIADTVGILTINADSAISIARIRQYIRFLM